MNKRIASLMLAYSTFTSMYTGNTKTGNSVHFEKTDMKGLSSKEMGTHGTKKKSRKYRKNKNGNKK